MDQQLTAEEVQELRTRHYDATVIEARSIHEQLLILRVRRDAGKLEFTAGQYTSLGLGAWEPSIAPGDEVPLAEVQIRHLIKRVYSIGAAMLDEQGKVVRATDELDLEFYLTLVSEEVARTPNLTHRLFALTPGDRLHVGGRAHGKYTLAAVKPQDQVVFVSTGTGEAPHNAMLSELLARRHPSRIVSVCCTRQRRDLAYLETHRRLEALYDHYQYVPLTTREPENVDQSQAGFMGKRYVQEFFESGEFERVTGLKLDPQQVHVFLCGNPRMIGVPLPAGAQPESLAPRGMLQVLERRGFVVDEPGQRGHVHFEKYW